jgi:DHA1 family tetracycline resistance protein-like MFS transporter
MSKEKAIIFLTVAIDVIGLGIIIPVLPLYVESFGLSAFIVTLLLSVFSLFSFLSAPLLGVLSDKIGRRPVLIISIASTSIGWFIFSFAKSLPILLLGRIIDGLAAGNISTAQSSISDMSKDAKERASSLGIIGMIFGFGFIIGPFIGGLLSKISPSFPFLFVGSLALANTILAYFFLPETNKHINKKKRISWNPLSPIIAAIKNKKLRILYLVWFMFNIVAVAANSIFALYLSKVFGFSAYMTGIFFTGIGIILTINQGFLIRKFWLEKFKEKQLIILMLGFFTVGFISMSIPYIWLFVIGMVFTAFGQSTLMVAMTSEIIGEADIKMRGESVGVLSAVASSANILAPLISGALFTFKHYSPYIFASMLSLVALAIMYFKKLSDRNSSEIESLSKEVIA